MSTALEPRRIWGSTDRQRQRCRKLDLERTGPAKAWAEFGKVVSEDFADLVWAARDRQYFGYRARCMP